MNDQIPPTSQEKLETTIMRLQLTQLSLRVVINDPSLFKASPEVCKWLASELQNIDHVLDQTGRVLK